MSVATRYAPSPTGPLHIGGARTALFSWAFARHHGGRFLLRFEDTDRARSSPEFEGQILDAIRWLGLDWDPLLGTGGIPRQSERGERYRELVDALLARGAAYRCICTPEELEQKRAQARASGATRQGYDGTCRAREIGPEPGVPFCVRLRVEGSEDTHVVDLVAGPSGQDASEIEDFVLQRTDRTPVYHLAVVIDDHDMGVTHVIRGREHLLSTPRQLLLYRALGFEPPSFAHVPLLVGAKGKKLSKRESAASVQSYRERGFTPEAVRNYLARLGWSHGDLEIFDLESFVRLFDLAAVGRSPAQVNEDKLLALQQHWLKALSPEKLHGYLEPFLKAEAGREVEVDAQLSQLLELLRPRSTTLAEMAQQAGFVLVDEIAFDEKASRKHLRSAARPLLADLRKALASVPEWSPAALEPLFREISEQHAVGMGALAQPTRVSITGSAASPGIFETVAAVGRERALARLDRALAYIDARNP